MEELILEKYIFTDQEFESQTELFEEIGGRLITDGFAKPSFIEALMKREEEFPTGLPTKYLKIAIPHTDASHVIKPCIVFMKLKKPVKFHEMGNNQSVLPIDMVILLAINDGKKHLDTLQKIIAIISDEELLTQLKQSTTKNEIYETVTYALSK